MGRRIAQHPIAGSRWAPALLIVALLVGAVGSSLAAPVAAARGDAEAQSTVGAEAVIQAATRYLGLPYRLGREGPDLFDCSGLIFRSFSDAGLLPLIGGTRTRAAVYMRRFARQGQYTTELAEARRGDLVIWGGGSHIGIYLGDGRALSAVISGVSVHGVDQLTRELTGFLRVDWNGDGAEAGAPVDVGGGLIPEVPAELVPASGWAPEISADVIAEAGAPGVEREDMRTAGSRTYQAADGAFTTEVFSRPIHYQPEGSTDWQPIDLRFVPADERRVAARLETSPVAIALDAVRRRGAFVALGAGEQQISLSVAGTRQGPVQPTLGPDGRYADYADLFGGRAGVRLFPRADGLKAFLVLAERPTDTRFDFVIEAPGLTPTLADDGSLTLATVDGDEAVARILPPLAISSRDIDGDGGGLSADAARLELGEVVDGRFTVSLVVGAAYLARAPYPLYVDLTIAGLGAAATDAGTTFVLSSWPTANFSAFQRPEWPAYPELWHGRLPARVLDVYSEAYLRFIDPVGNLQGIDLESASLRLLPYWQFDGEAPTWISQPAEEWDVTGVSWDTRPALAAELASVETQAGAWADIELTEHLRAVVAGEQPDHGFVLHADTLGKRGWKRIAAPARDAELEPRLVVRWRTLRPVPVEPFAGAWSTGQLAWIHAAVAPDQTRYEVEVRSAELQGEPISSGIVRGPAGRLPTWTIPARTLRNGESYVWRVRAKYGKGKTWSEWSTPAPFVYGTAAGSQVSAPPGDERYADYDAGERR